MKLLHTSDWHLGIRLLGKDREEEQANALSWLLETIVQEKIDVLVIAGDIFDTGVPSNSARKLYYNFLRKLVRANCAHVIIIGGNHDSPSMLDAPREILEMLNIHVVGSAGNNSKGEIVYENEILELKNENEELIAVVGAVPFLRDRDIMQAVAGQSFGDRVEDMRQGLKKHYAIIAELMADYKDVPCIVTGHLFTDSASLSGDTIRQEGENDIHIGNLARVDSSSFEDAFDYVALGHIHKPQVINKKEHVRYSGSMIQISFSERKDDKQVVIVEFSQDGKRDIGIKHIPQSRNLIRYKGTFEEIRKSVNGFVKMTGKETWAELVFTEKTSSVAIQELKDKANEKGIEVLKVKFDIPIAKIADNNSAIKDKELDELTIEDIFNLKCEAENLTQKESKDLHNTFAELKSWMNQQD